MNAIDWIMNAKNCFNKEKKTEYVSNVYMIPRQLARNSQSLIKATRLIRKDANFWSYLEMLYPRPKVANGRATRALPLRGNNRL